MYYCELSKDIIFYEILTRVDAKDLVRFKTVCKLWYNKINDSNFVDAHLHRLNSRSQRQIILTATELSKDSWHMAEHMAFDIDGKNMMTNTVAKFNMIIPGKNDYKKLLAGCNGLLLLSGYDYGLYVCNLVTRRYTALPALPCRLDHWTVINGRWIFFYDTYVRRYKLFGIFYKDVLMLTSGDKKWKKVPLPLPNFPNLRTELTTPVFADKELHWLASTFEVINTKCVTKDFMIYSFDIKSSEFRKIKLLPTLNAEHYNMFISSKNEESSSLWFAAVFPDHLDVWGLSNNGMTKKFSASLQKLSYIPAFWSTMCIVEDGDSNGISELKLFIKHGNELLYHDLKSGVLRQIGKTNYQKQYLKLETYQFHVDSLVSWHPADEYKRKIDDEQ